MPRHSGQVASPAALRRETTDRSTSAVPASPEHDLAAVRFAARGRVLVATAAALITSLASIDGGNTSLLYLLGLFWVPVSGVLALNADTWSARVTRLAGAACDLIVLGVLATMPDMGALVLSGSVVVVAVGMYTGGLREGVWLSAFVLAIVATTDALRPSSELHFSQVSFAAVLGFMLLVLDRAMRQQRRAILHSDYLLDRAGTILERVADGVVLTDASGHILDANPAAARIVGCEPEALNHRRCEEVLGLHSGERQLDCSGGCALLALSKARDGDAGHEVWRADPGGHRRPLLANVSAIVDDGGEVREVVHSLRDITSLKQADEAKTLFLATASHELKTPLTVIRGYGEILLHNPNLPDEMRGQAASAIVRRSSELSDIVDRLLLSSRIEAGRLKLELTAVDVAPIVHERTLSLQAATGRAVGVDMPSEVPSVVGDGAAVTTVLDHLLDNAVKYSPGGEAVDVWVAADDERLHLRVTDHGIGMDAEQASHCFDKFWQAESTDVRRFRGTGIGLYVVASLVEAMGGSVGLNTAPGQGTSFTVSLLRSDVVVPAPTDASGNGEREPGQGENSIVREFMRQIGVLETPR